MQTLLAAAIVLVAMGYLAWHWRPRRRAAHGSGSSDCGSCTGCAH